MTWQALLPIVLATGTVLLGGCDAPTPPPPPSYPDMTLELEGPTTVPMELDYLPTIDVRLPDYGWGRFLVDTGAAATILNETFVDIHKVPTHKLEGNHSLTRGGEAVRPVNRAARIPSMHIGEARVSNLVTWVVDLEYFNIGDDPLDGILGQDVLRKCALIIEKERMSLTLAPSDQVDKHLQAHCLGMGFLSLPLAYEPKTPKLYLEFKGLSIPFTVDTGAVTSSYPQKLIDALGLEPFEESVSQDIGGTRKTANYHAPNLSIGPWEIEKVVVGHYPGEYGLLGFRILSEFVIVVNGPKEEIQFGHAQTK